MEKQSNAPKLDESRRKFLEKAGKVSVAVPAAAILLSGGIPTEAQAAYAQCPPGQVPTPGAPGGCDFPS